MIINKSHASHEVRNWLMMSYEKGFEDGGHLGEDGPALLSESLYQAVDSCLTLLRSVFHITSTPE